jgi:hypothetical protein
MLFVSLNLCPGRIIRLLNWVYSINLLNITEIKTEFACY